VTVVAGDALTVLGRVRSASPKRATVTGILNGKKFKQSYRLELIKLKDAGDLKLRWASNRLNQLLREGAGREEMVELGTRFGLITPYTSFYVPSTRELDESSEERQKTDEARNKADQSIADMKQKVVVRGKGYRASEKTLESDSLKSTTRFSKMSRSEAKDKAGAKEEEKPAKGASKKIAVNGERGGDSDKGKDRAPAEPMAPPASTAKPADDARRAVGRKVRHKKLRARRYKTITKIPAIRPSKPMPAAKRPATGSTARGAGTLGVLGKSGQKDRGVADAFGGPGGGSGGAGFGIRGRSANQPRVLSGKHRVFGSMDKNVIRRVVRRHLSEVRYCYQSKGLPTNPRLAGNVKVNFVIGKTGRVRRAMIASSTLRHPATQRCITTAMRRWRFPKPTGGGMVVVRYPFAFRPATVVPPTRRVRVDVHVHIKIDKHKPKRCSPASKKSLKARRTLWRERLRAKYGLRGVLEVWQDARLRCELPSWRDRRVLLSLMLNRLGSVRSMLRLFRYFRYSWGASRYLALSILGRVRTPAEDNSDGQETALVHGPGDSQQGQNARAPAGGAQKVSQAVPRRRAVQDGAAGVVGVHGQAQ
jgi:TonB family protein